MERVHVTFLTLLVVSAFTVIATSEPDPEPPEVGFTVNPTEPPPVPELAYRITYEEPPPPPKLAYTINYEEPPPPPKLAYTITTEEPPPAPTEDKCDQEQQFVSPCVGYLAGSEGSPSNNCCKGLLKLKASLSTRNQRQAACQCFKTAITGDPFIKNNVAALPKLCAVTLGFPLSTSVDCNKIP